MDSGKRLEARFLVRNIVDFRCVVVVLLHVTLFACGICSVVYIW